jgi:hypothetical protein
MEKVDLLAFGLVFFWKCFQIKKWKELSHTTDNNELFIPSDLLITSFEEFNKVKDRIKSNSGEKIALEFQNHTKENLNFYWITYNGEEV